MSPRRDGADPPFNAQLEARLAAAMKETLVLAATEADADRRQAPQPVAEWSEADPPTSEDGILALVLATQHEIITGKLNPAAAMDLVARRAQFLTDAAGAVIELLEGTELVYRAASGSAARSLGLRVDTQRSMSGLCFLTQKAMRCDDTETDDRVDKAACRWVGIRSMVLVPVVRDGQSLGVLAVISPAMGSFGDGDVRTVQLMAGVLAEALGQRPTA